MDDVLLETDEDGLVTVDVTSDAALPMEFDQGDALLSVMVVDVAGLVSAKEAQQRNDIVRELDADGAAKLVSACELEDELRAKGGGEGGSCFAARADSVARRRPPVYSAEPKTLPVLHNADFEQLTANMRDPKYTIVSIHPDVWDREDVLPSIVLYSGMGGISTGSIAFKDGMHIITAVAVESEEAECQTHRMNNPSVPMLQMRMVNHTQTMQALTRFLPRRHWRRAWVHASNSCRRASTGNMFGRDIDAARQDTDWAIALLEKMRPAVWTVENVEPLHRFYKGKYATAYVFKLWQHCRLAQDRKRLIISNKPLFLPRINDTVSMRQVLQERKGWDSGKQLWCRNAWGYPRSVDGRAPTVTSGYLLAGAETMGELGSQHILDSGDRALLQGYDAIPLWPNRLSESNRKRMVAQCVPPPFAEALSRATFEYQQQTYHKLRTQARMATLEALTDEEEVAAYVAAGMPAPAGWLKEEVADCGAAAASRAGTPDACDDCDPSVRGGTRFLKLGKHGKWKSCGEFGWCKATIPDEVHARQIQLCPWLMCNRPPDSAESHLQFRRRRDQEKLAAMQRLLEQAEMSAHDTADRAGHKKETAAARLSRHFTNVAPDPERLRQRDTNLEKQQTQPEWYGAYLEEGECYQTPRTKENWHKACAELGLDELPAEDAAERDFYANLVWDLWILFDDKLRPISGVEIDLDMSGVKPLRAHPYRWSPAKVAAGKQLIQEFIEDGILTPITSEWASPALLVPKPKGGWRLVVDLRELNKLIPHDTYEPPSCDLCLEWLAGRPYRTTADMRWGFHQVLLSERTRKIFTLVTPFGTYAYTRLVMGYINATAEFQRHMNNTLGPALWDYCLSMVDDLIIGSPSKQEHRIHVTAVLTRLAQRGHSIKPSKAHILRQIVEYLGHMSTPQGTRPTEKHIQAIIDMPFPLADAGPDGRQLADKTKVRSFLGFAKFQRRYIKDCGLICAPLNELTNDDSTGEWTPLHVMVFNRIKRDIRMTRGVWHPNFKHPFYVCSDGSKRGLGGYLFQMIDGEERVISYFSRSTTKAEREWDTRELELLAMICTLEYFRHYIEGQKLFLQTDRRNLTWLSRMKGRSDRLGRWVLRLSEFPHELAYRKGNKMLVADCMSRLSAPNTGTGPRLVNEGTAMEREEWQEAQATHTVSSQTTPCMVIEQLNEFDSVSNTKTVGQKGWDTDGVPAVFKVQFDVCTQEEAELSDGFMAQQDACARALAVTSVEDDGQQSDGGSFGDFDDSDLESVNSTDEDESQMPDLVVDSDSDTDSDDEDERDAAPIHSVEGAASHGDEGESPLVMPECLDPTPVSMEEIAREQTKDTFGAALIQKLQAADASHIAIEPKRGLPSKFALLGGVLYRITEAGDPKEGYDSARVYIPESLRDRVMNTHHVSVWGAHRGETATFKELVSLYYWPKMERSVHDYVRRCKWCELAKGTKPSRQGFARGWQHNEVNRMICMDLMGPFGQTSTGHVRHKQPFYLLVITDPFSHMLWLEPLTGKSAEEVYSKFVQGYLLEEGAPMMILTDRGKEFDNVLLKELMRLLRVRLHFTPAYHPRGNYTERVNRFIGTSLRTMLAMPGARQADWWKLTKFVQFAYRRMHIPGTNLTPYMVARGRQPRLPLEIEQHLLDGAIPNTERSLDEHVLELQKNIVLAAQLLRAARNSTLEKSREKFNQKQIEVTFHEGERVRLWKHVTVRHGADENEISTKLKLDNAEYVVVGPIGESTTRYKLKHAVTGKEKDAHVSQFARMRVQQLIQDQPTLGARDPEPTSDEKTWDKLRPATYAVVWRKGWPDEPASVLRVVEVLNVDHDEKEFVGWHYVHGGRAARGGYDHEKPLVQRRLIPEWCNNRTGKVEPKPSPAVMQHCRKVVDEFTADTVELIATGWSLESGGKIPSPVIDKCDAWLRARKRGEPRCVIALSSPTEAEKQQARRLL